MWLRYEPDPAGARVVVARHRLQLRDGLEDALARRGFYKGRDRGAFRPRLDELLGKMDLSERDVAVVRDLVTVLAGER